MQTRRLSIHLCHQTRNPARETVPLNLDAKLVAEESKPPPDKLKALAEARYQAVLKVVGCEILGNKRHLLFRIIQNKYLENLLSLVQALHAENLLSLVKTLLMVAKFR